MSSGFVEDVDGRLVPAPSRDGYQLDREAGRLVPSTTTVCARDAYVVPSEPVSAAVQSFVADWKRTRPPDGGGGARPQQVEVTRVRALDWLEQETGLSTAEIQPFMQGKRPTVDKQRLTHVDLRVADELLRAIGRTDLLASLPVRREL